MPFNFLGTMRQCQWRAFRNWVLTERRAVGARLRVIKAELTRIGHITVFYERQEETVITETGAEQTVENVTEVRRAFRVSEGSSLEKLVQAYIAAGGNPMAISLFLQPDEILFTTDEDPLESPDDDHNEQATDIGFASTPYDLPSGGAFAPGSTTGYGPGGPPVRPNNRRDVYKQVGRYFDQGDASGKVAVRMDHARRWVRQELTELSILEGRIVKLMDLREQLINERDVLLVQSVGGSVQDLSLPPDPDRFPRNLHLTRIVAEMDRTFYELNADGEPDFDTLNVGTAESPAGISFYDTLLRDVPGTDPFC